MRRHSEKKYPQISVSRETYEKLRALKFELRVDSLNDVIAELLKRIEKK
jgi:hypothetical protein